MGGGLSSGRGDVSPTANIIVPSRHDPTRRPIAVNSMQVEDASIASMTEIRATEIDEESRELLIDAFGDFFMLDREDNNNLRTELLIHACSKEYASENTILMREGDIGNKLYVVQSGHLEVSIDGSVVRHVGAGALIGEIALLYNAPRSATVKCLTDCAFFILTREDFKRIQDIASSASLLRRGIWLQSCAEILSLGTVDVSRLAGVLETQYFSKGEHLYYENEFSNKVYLIEEGSVECNIIGDEALFHEDSALINKYLGIARPEENKEKKHAISTIKECRGESSPPSSCSAISEKVDQELLTETTAATTSVLLSPTVLHTGCMVCINLISDTYHESIPDRYKLHCKQPAGAVMPFSAVVTSDKAQCSYFTVDNFMAMFGRPGEPIATTASSESDINRSYSDDLQCCRLQFSAMESVPRPNRGGLMIDNRKVSNVKDIVLREDAFKELLRLGKGSYGTVTYARHLGNNRYYALKRIAKSDVRSDAHIRYIYDECKILLSMKNAFIIPLHGVFMTPDEIVLVMTPAPGGDLWRVIYETKMHSRGLPLGLIKFYIGSIILGLSHIHKQGVAFRDLKPENIMLDKEGFIYIIDFGFAKKIPYVTVDKEGRSAIKMKSFTLCGTPDYLAPEFIFNSGVNHSADLWALGCILHEMIMLTTPFRPSRKSDLTSLFVNISSVKKMGLKLSPSIDQRTGGPDASILISQLLRAEPTQRIGSCDTALKIFETSFFKDFEYIQLKKKQMTPPFHPIPSFNCKPCEHTHPRYIHEKKIYEGSQTRFAAFNDITC